MRKWICVALVPLVVGAWVFFAWQDKRFPFRENPYLSLSVQFTSSNLPCTEIEIEGIKCLAKIDLGSGSECDLDHDLLERISKTFYRTSKWFDVKGNAYEANEYIIPLLKIKTAEIRKLKAKEQDPKCETEGSHLWGPPETMCCVDKLPIGGRLGRALLQSLHPFFDFKNSVFYFTRGYKSLRALKQEGYRVEVLRPSFFKMTHYGCIFNIETEYGSKQFMVDTGASVTLIKPSKFPGTEECKTAVAPIVLSKFKIGDQDFENTKVYLFEFSDKIENVDGILGMDFFQENVVFLDFDTQKAWIAPSKDVKKVISAF